MKSAVVFILDASPSMSRPCQDDTGQSRLECAKQAIEDMVCDLMLQGKTNEASIIVCKTQETRHHLSEVGTKNDDEESGSEASATSNQGRFAHFTEIPTCGIRSLSLNLLRDLANIEASSSDVDGGGICDSIILAEDALRKRTVNAKGKPLQFDRRIVLFTDAGQNFAMNVPKFEFAMNSLRELSCRLHVIGIGFEHSGVFVDPARKGDQHDESESQSIENVESRENQKVDEESEKGDGDEDHLDGEEDDEEDDEEIYESQSDKEQFLVRLTNITGGVVIAASTMQQILAGNRGKKLQHGTKTNIELRVAPGLCVQAKSVKLMEASKTDRVRKEVVVVDEDTNEPMRNALGEEMMDSIKEITSYIGEETAEDVVDDVFTTTAIKYGADLQAMTPQEIVSAMSAPPGPRRIEILGYKNRESLPSVYVQGPPYVISGDQSKRASEVIAALAQALDRSKKAAICINYKSKNSSNPVLGALLPLRVVKAPIHLVFLQLPFSGDARKLYHINYLHVSEQSSDSKANICDDLIDSMMLPEGVLESDKIPHPMVRAWNLLKIKRALDPKSELVKSHIADKMKAPAEICEQAQPALEAFYSAFPFVTVNAEKEKPANP